MRYAKVGLIVKILSKFKKEKKRSRMRINFACKGRNMGKQLDLENSAALNTRFAVIRMIESTRTLGIMRNIMNCDSRGRLLFTTRDDS